MKKFRTNWLNSIDEYNVIKETPSRITYEFMRKNCRTDKDELLTDCENKSSNHHSWHETFDEAKQYLIKKQEGSIESYLRQIERFKEEIEKIKQLTQ